jgi:ribose transport system substrate-binding protein
MKKIRLGFGLGLLILSTIFFSFSCTEKQQKKKIGFIVTTLNNPFFVDMTEGAKKEAQKYPDIELIIQAPERGTGEDIDRQIQIMENMISQKVALICVVPASSKGIISAIIKANAANVPILNIDNKIDNELAAQRGARIAGFIGSDNYGGGKLAGEYIAARLDKKGKAAILEGVSGVDAAIDRKAGFMDYIKDYPNINVVASQPADWSREKGLNVFQNMLQAFPDIQAVFACNDEMALGAIQAIKLAKKEGKIIIVGFDAIKDALDAVKAGTLDATIAQQPDEMGKMAIDNAINLLNNIQINQLIKTELRLIIKKDILR